MCLIMYIYRCKRGDLSLYGLQLQLYSINELIAFQQDDSSGGEAVYHDNFKIEKEKMGATGGRESMSKCVQKLVKLAPLIMHLNEFMLWLIVEIIK